MDNKSRNKNKKLNRHAYFSPMRLSEMDNRTLSKQKSCKNLGRTIIKSMRTSKIGNYGLKTKMDFCNIRKDAYSYYELNMSS